MTRKVIQIKGTHGSGKSTIVKQLIGLSSDIEILKWSNGKPYATLLNDLKWVILGTYPNPDGGGGCDNLNHEIRPIETMKIIILDLISKYPNYWMVFEGALIGKSMTMYNHLVANIPDDCIITVFLHSDLKTCMSRLESRRGAPLLDNRNVVDKLNVFLRDIKKHSIQHTASIDTNRLAKEDMVYEFLSVIDWKLP